MTCMVWDIVINFSDEVWWLIRNCFEVWMEQLFCRYNTYGGYSSTISCVSTHSELHHTWRGHATWVKWIYAFIRYSPAIHGRWAVSCCHIWACSSSYADRARSALFFAEKPGSKCHALIAYELSYFELLTLTVEIVLVARGKFLIDLHRASYLSACDVIVSALYKHNKTLNTIILVTFAAEVVCMMVLVSFVIKEQTFTADCLVATSPREFVGYWWVVCNAQRPNDAWLIHTMQAHHTVIRDVPLHTDNCEMLSKHPGHM